MLKSLLVASYRYYHLRGAVLWALRHLEGDHSRSPTLREIFRKYWGVDIGMYTHGAFLAQGSRADPWILIDGQTTIGRYCSIAKGVRIINHNHPLALKSTSPYFFNPGFGLTSTRLAEVRPLEIGNDVWIGHNVVVLAEVSRIGDGAVIGAGAVVHRDVPPYAVVLGNPGRVVRYRFPEDVIDRLLEERWWDSDVEALSDRLEEFSQPL